MADRRKELPDGYDDVLFDAGRYDVVGKASVLKELEKKASREKRAGLAALVQKYAKDGPPGLPRTKFNGNEGWFPSSKASGKVCLQAFKPWQLRAYGFCRELAGRPTFFITGIDPAKKQDRANPAKLSAAGSEAVRLNALLDGKGG